MQDLLFVGLDNLAAARLRQHNHVEANTRAGRQTVDLEDFASQLRCAHLLIQLFLFHQAHFGQGLVELEKFAREIDFVAIECRL